MSQVIGLPNNSYKPITNTAWVRARLCKLQKGCTRLTTTSDKVYQLLAHGRWFSPGTPASSITKTGHHDITEILLKVALSNKNEIKSNQIHLIRSVIDTKLSVYQSSVCVLNVFCHSKNKQKTSTAIDIIISCEINFGEIDVSGITITQCGGDGLSVVVTLHKSLR